MDEFVTRGEIRVEARLRNNVLWHLIFDTWKSAAEFCRKYDLSATQISELLNLSISPVKENGQYRKICLQLSQIFRMLPEDLFPSQIYAIERTQAVLEIPLSQLPAAQREIMQLAAPETPEDVTNRREFRKRIRTVLATLTSKEEWVLMMRFGLTNESKVFTAEELGQGYGVTRERIRQIEVKALRHLRHPSRSRHLKDFLEGV